jgi:hypothetical protein
MGLLSHAVVMSCETCRMQMIDECPLEVDEPDEYVCRNYLPGVRIDPRVDYAGEFET